MNKQMLLILEKEETKLLIFLVFLNRKKRKDYKFSGADQYHTTREMKKKRLDCPQMRLQEHILPWRTLKDPIKVGKVTKIQFVFWALTKVQIGATYILIKFVIYFSLNFSDKDS